MALEVEVKKRYAGFTLDASLVAERGPVALLGASGAGKSLVLRTIAGLVRPDSGRIVLDGRVLFDSRRGIDEPTRRRRVGLLFQQYALFPHLTVEENIGFGLGHLAAEERAQRTADQIVAMHLGGFERRYSKELSGGQQQRVALARALAPEPAALLLDEPFSALDTHLRSQLERQLHETLSAYSGVTLLVSHNLEELYRLCGEIVVLEDGRVIAQGERDQIFRRPPNKATARLTGCKNFSRARALDGSHCVEAVDWGCSLRVAQATNSLAHVGIRANHIVIEPPDHSAGSGQSNRFPVWVAAETEGPFRVTLYLRFNGAASDEADYHVQAEVLRENYAVLKRHPLPWVARLDEERLFLLPD
jgi:molybdate transport system permease protein